MTYNTEKLINDALAAGFSQAGELNVKALVFMPEVRDMCSADKCHTYNKNWRCPPACGTIEDAARHAAEYSYGILVQTIGQMEDEYDYETIKEAGDRHKDNFAALVEKLKIEFGDILPMGAGTCTICPKCAYPDEPCRFPDKSISSMEAYGLWVSRVCELSGIPYYNGKNTITYTSCYLLK
jgi:predicted metal-binding protein